jgi:hypothetical protein
MPQRTEPVKLGHYPTDDNRQRGEAAPMLSSAAMNAPACEVNESTVCPVDSSLWL